MKDNKKYRTLLRPTLIGNGMIELLKAEPFQDKAISFFMIHNTDDSDEVEVTLYHTDSASSANEENEIAQETLKAKKTIFIEFPKEGYLLSDLELDKIFIKASVANKITVSAFGDLIYRSESKLD